MRLHIVRLLLTAFIVLTAATSCYNYDQEESVAYSDITNYINVTLTVRTSNSSMTRANTPKGGEDGDGREKGIDTRENAVDGVTLIFYQDAANTTAGINATPTNAEAITIDHAVYYTVELAPVDYEPRYGTHYPDEVYYTTGKRELTLPLSSKNTYRMLVVANANIESQITPGTTTLAQVRDMVLTKVYDNSGISASNFVMSSEREAVIDFAYSTYDETTNSQTFQIENIHIERMAARIDYHAAGAVYSTDYDHKGYVYDVGTKDHFVLTSITPFNLNLNSDNGNEYIFKRTNSGTPYLAKETTTSWVIDPYTASKTGTSQTHPAWMVNTLTAVEGNQENVYKITMEDGQTGKLTIDGRDDIIIAYPKENTLNSDSRLYYHATGIAFEGYYYTNNAKTGGERRVFYHYLRHQGDAESYEALKSPLDKTVICGSTTPMNYGVVRNNIYRISVEGFNQVEGTIKIKIEEKKWRHVDNPTIYI